MRIADCKRTPKNPQSEITGPMLFARNALASGPQACFLTEKAIAKGKAGKGRFYLAGI
jgi:hypothetical protein